MAPNPLTTDASAATPASPGVLLRTQRIARGWSEATAAETLHLSLKQLQALENDEYQNLPESTYILGYWKSYANLLNISIDDAIAIYREKLLQADPHIASGTHPRKSRRYAKRSHIHFAWAFTLLSVFFLLAIWQWQKPTPQVSSLDTSQVVQDGASAVLPNAFIRMHAEQRQNGANQSLLHSLKTLPQPNFVAENYPSKLDLTKIYAAHSDILEAQKLAGVDSQLGKTVGEAPQNEPVQYDDADFAVSLQTVSPNQIGFVIKQESWLEVLDAAGTQLIYRVADRGQLLLEGRPPFSVFIGNAGGVRVEYLGQIVPLPSQKKVSRRVNQKRLFARFKVGLAH